MTSQEFQILIALHALSIVFSAGVAFAILKSHGSDIKSLKKNEERHDREIGVVYGHNKLQREVRG